jgi:hypothetical protein
LNFAVAGSCRLTEEEEEEENLAGRAEQLPDVMHTEFHASCCQNLLRLAGRPPEHHHQRLMSPRNLSSIGNPFFSRFSFSFLKFELDVSET